MAYNRNFTVLCTILRRGRGLGLSEPCFILKCRALSELSSVYGFIAECCSSAMREKENLRNLHIGGGGGGVVR